MSYILEALKKADQAREYGQVPGIDSPHEQPVQRPPRRRWAWLLAAALLVNALLIAGLWWQLGPAKSDRSNTSERPANQVAERAPKVQISAAPPATPPEAAVPAVTTVKPPIETAVTPAINTPPTANSRNAAPAAEPARPSPVMALRPLPLPAPGPPPTAAPAPPETIPQQVEKAPEPDPRQTPALANRTDVVQLRAAVQPPPPVQTEPAWKKLPLWPLAPESIRRQVTGRLVLNAHVYSEDPAERFVLLNMQKYKEGEQIPEGPDIEEITRDGVILAVPSGRFRLE